jgi:hypothetical protein
VEDVIDRVPQRGARAAYFKQAIRDKLIEHRHYIEEHGEDMPEITEWRWAGPTRASRGAPRRKPTTSDHALARRWRRRRARVSGSTTSPGNCSTGAPWSANRTSSP